MRVSSWRGAAFMLWAVGCHCATGQVAKAPPVAPAIASPKAARPEVPTLRLPAIARPVRYAVDLRIVPTEETFGGTMDIDLELLRPTGVLWLNGAQMTIEQARLETGGQALPLHPIAGGTDFIGFGIDRSVGPGPAHLHIAYKAHLSAKDSRGLFRQQDGADWYAFSHFEPIDARYAFPCFDEPSYKVPWQLTLHVRKTDVALANTPIEKEADEPDGMKGVRFAPSKPLPSYLVALAVGPFELVDAGPGGGKQTPVRIIAERGKAAEARWAASATPPILGLLEKYFGIPYPYEKLDVIAIPHTSYGAMENPGLITFRQSLLLAKPVEETIAHKRGYAGTIAHELAHQWFGDLVTHAWWNDIWLNEAFATWMEEKIIDQWKPEWGKKVSKVSMRSAAMGADSLVTARKIRQPIESKNDIENVFDGITYGKGASVLGMFEAWLSPETFQKGVRRYLTQHAYGNATSADFLAAVSAEAGRDIAAAFFTFLDQPGVPLVTVEVSCAPGSKAHLRLSQERYLPLGSPGSAAETWQIPMAGRYRKGNAKGTFKLLLTEPNADQALDVDGCPDWVLPNEGEMGYYRVAFRGDSLSRLLKKGSQELSLPERIGVLGDVRALVQNGKVAVGDVLALVPMLAQDDNRYILQSTMGIVWSLHANLIPNDLREHYARFVRKMFGSKAHALGFRAKSSEDEDTRLLRPEVVSMVADAGADRALQGQAKELARRWLDDRTAVEGDMVDVVLGVAAQGGDRALFDRFHAEARKTQDRNERRRLLGAMAQFRERDILEAALGLVLSDEFDIRDAMGIVWGSLGDRELRDVTYEFVKRSFDALVAKLPRESGARLAQVAGGFCDEAHRADAQSFFEGRSTKYTGGPRILANVLEQIRLCSAMREAQLPQVEAFLRRY